MLATYLALAATVSWCIGRGALATVDPDNATTLVVEDGTRFNVTHYYWRDRVRAHPVSLVGVWVNPYELPETLQYYTRDGRWRTLTRANDIYNRVTRMALRVLGDWSVASRRVFFADYYRKLALESDFIGGRPLIPLDRGFDARLYDKYAFPLQIHFRYKPYPQSSFGEFVTNRAVSWRVWERDEDYRRSGRVGDDDDLLYRMRHNLGHSLGLGHTTSRRCIMYPTNVRGLHSFCPNELSAMRRLLSNQPLIARREQQRYDVRPSDDREDCVYVNERRYCSPNVRGVGVVKIRSPYVDVRRHQRRRDCYYVNGQLLCSVSSPSSSSE